jgi:hypothetical protein
VAINFANDLPLLIAGTEVPVNPSFEDWVSGAPRGWTVSGVTAETTLVFPCGERSCAIANGGSISQTLSLSSFGFTSFPTWATSFGLAVCARGGNATISVNGTTKAMVNGSGWGLTIQENAAVGTIGITNSSGSTCYVDSIMAGFLIDLDVPMKNWNPQAKMKGSKRASSYGTHTNLLSDAWDLKAELVSFESALKIKLTGFISYVMKGHYYAAILDRAASGNYQDEIFPYLYFNSQDAPDFKSGAPNVFGLKFNGEGCLP